VKKKWFSFKSVIRSITEPDRMEPLDVVFKEVPGTMPKEALVQDALAGIRKAQQNNSHLFNRDGFKPQ
jgi:hypothetical protein